MAQAMQHKIGTATQPGQRTHEGPNKSKGQPAHYRICRSCVMDTSDPGIQFASDGTCHHCRAFFAEILPNWDTGEAGRRRLDAMTNQIKAAGRGKDFDCLIGLSGGIDSSYLTYVAKEVMGLRPLLFHVDAGWNSQEATNNIERLVERLDLDLYTEVIDWEEMRDLQLAFFKSGVPHLDFPQDHAFFATMYRFALKHKVRHILTGANISTECINNPVGWVYYPSDSTQLRDIHRRFGSRPLNTFPTTSVLWHKAYLPYVKRIRVARPLNHVPYVKKEAMEFLAKEFGWQPYPQKHFESRFTKFFEGHWLPTRFGYDTRRAQFSSLILTDQMTREAALETLQAPALDASVARREYAFVADKLGITPAELDQYHAMPKRTYRDYKSQAWVYAAGARVARILGGIEGSGRR